MLRVLSAGGALVTSDAVGVELLRYAVLLMKHRGVDEVAIPIALPDGRTSTSTVLLGRLSEIAVLPIDAPEVELDDEATVALIREKRQGPIRESHGDDLDSGEWRAWKRWIRDV